MRIVSTNFIPDRSRPGLTTTAIGAVDLQGAGGNWATVGRRSRGGRRVRRQREKRKGKSVGLRIGTLNVGTMTGKGRELADVMERRKVDILCVQETRWKGSKARSIGAGFKLFYYGVDSKRNGVGVVLKEEFVRNVLEVKRVSDRVMSLKLEFEGVMLNVVSGYAPQVGCELEEKERFWSELDEVMESIPTGERVVIGADFNGHVGEGNTGDEEVMGKFGVKERNLEGQMVVDFAKRMDMAVVNTYFQKREEHRVTYKSGGRRTQVDYILCRRGNLKEISDCKVVVGESVARQHRMVVCRMTLMVCKTKRSKIEKKTKWWKLKKEECCEEFRQKLRQALGGQVVLPDDWETTAEVIRETGRKVLGVSSGRRKEDKETWWWNEEVQDSIQRKRLAKKKWDMDRTEENRQEYKELQRRVKRKVSKAKQKAYEELYTRLDTREGEKDLYRLARQRDRDGKDVQQVRVIKDRDGRVLTSEESVQRRWKEYFEELMNEENEREKRVEGVNSVEQKVDKIRKDEVRKALKRMKSGKAVGPDDIPVEVWKCLGEAAVEFLANLFNRVLESERMPEEWRRSVLVPIFKKKGDVQSCSNYRGIKLMSHTMKVWERVVEARLRKVVEICEQQYGFMPRKSTTDAIFALRILMEKYRDGQRELHCVFVDLEKAYDRVPREELWYCMRKSGVVEKYVRVVQDMYERSRTVVRCAVGQTEEFNVEVGLHQGSALSPFLFAMVMDQLSEEVRQESPWTMMFADDIVICSESREQVEENLERWRFALERRGMKVSRSKTEYMCVNEREGSGTVRLQGEEVKKVQEFKYLGSTVQSNGECGKEVKKRVQAGWNGWRKVSGVLCDQKISARIKGKVYRTVVRPAMLYGLETVSLRKRLESELEVAELKMLRFSLGVTRLDRIRNEYIRGTAHVGRLGDKVREARLRWFGHVQRRESAAPDAPNPSPSQKVRSSDGSWGGARNVERPVGGARSRARHLGGGGEREAKARRVGGSEDQGEASGGNEDQGKARGGSEKQERDKWGEQRTRRQGQRVRRDVHNRAEAPNDVHSRAAEPSDVHSRAAGPSDVHRRAAAPSDVHRRALAPSDVHRRTTAPWRRCPSRWGLELPKGREGGSKVLPELSSAGNRTVTSPGLASPGPHPGAKPEVGARRRAPGGRVFACGTRLGTARRKDVGSPSRRPTTRRKEHKGPVPCVLGSSHGRGPRRPKPWTKNLAFGTWNVTSLGGKGDRRVCSNYREITLLSLPGKVYSRVLERRVRPLVEPRIQEEQCGFRPSRGTLDQLYTLHRVLEGSWEFAQTVHMCFVDMEKAFDRVPRSILWEVLWEYGVRGPLLRAVWSLYNRSRSLVCIASCKSDLFPVHVGLRQGCPLSPVLFIVFMDRISRRSQGLEGIQFGDHRISSLIFADDVVLLALSSLDLQHALGRFAAECEAAGMRVSTSKSEAMVLDRKKVACTLQVGGEVLPQVEEFKYLGVLFTSEGRMDREIDRRIGAATAVMRSMYRSVVVKKGLSRKAKLSIYQSIYVPTLTYGHELWVMTERVRSRIQAAEMSFLRRVAERSLRDRVRSSVTREELGVEPLLFHIERGQLRWLGHLFWMPPGGLPGEVFRACPTGKRPRGRPRTRWRDYVSRLAWERLGVPLEELEE
ncbi:hypothetical protein QTP86_015137, partial [Hemibagrus guttatus]